MSNDKNLTAYQIETIFKETLKNIKTVRNDAISIPQISNKIEKRMEHTLLKNSSSSQQVESLCEEAIDYKFRAVCCLPKDISYCKTKLKSSDVIIVSVLDFPLGASTPASLASMCSQAIKEGADEVDMVINVRSILEDNIEDAVSQISAVTKEAGNTPVKVILETCFLNETQIVKACAASYAAGASFVKTSTGFGPRGATVRDIEIMKAAVGDNMRIKASGGISTSGFSYQLIKAGADVIGTSNGKACIKF